MLRAGRPAVSIGHDLYWWRHDDAGLRTAVSFYWPDGWEFERVLAVLRWFDPDGALTAEHEVWLAVDRVLSIDSGSPPVPVPLEVDGADAVLSIELFADGEAIDSDEDRHRLYGLIDWYSEAGDIVTLHSDHCVLLKPQKLALTEIALRPWEHDDLQLVFVTADEALPAGAWTLTITNAAGEALTRSIDAPWAPSTKLASASPSTASDPQRTVRSLSVHVAPVVDAQYGHHALVVVDAVQNSVRAAASAVNAGKLVA